MDDVVIQKLASIRRCLASVRTYVAGDLGRLGDVMVLDAVVLNLQRACEMAIDPAIVRTVVEHRLVDFEDLCQELAVAS